jgi:hypothetical protein
LNSAEKLRRFAMNLILLKKSQIHLNELSDLFDDNRSNTLHKCSK